MGSRTRQTNEKNWVTEIFKKIAEKTGTPIYIEPDYQHTGYFVFKKKKIFFRSERFNINNAGSIETTTDKNYCHFFLKHFGYNTPEGQTFFSKIINNQVENKRTINDGYQYALSLGMPVILKPNNGSKGRFVTKVDNEFEYYKVARKIFKYTPVIIVEKYYTGEDFRIIVFNNRVFAAYKRTPLTIVGTGTKTIKTLIEEAKTKIETSGNGKINLNDERIKQTLIKVGRTKNQVLNKDETLILLQNANISSGGQMEDVTAIIHPTVKKLAIQIARDFNLVLCGIDIISKDIAKPDANYVILEINSAPALKHYASIGSFQLRRTERLYTQIFKHLQTQ